MKNIVQHNNRLSLWACFLAIGTAAVFIAATVISPCLARAEEGPDQANAKAGAKPATAPIGLAGQKVHIDPKTGKLRRPEPEEAARLSEGLKQLVNQSAHDLKPVRYPDGSVSVNLQGRFLSASFAKVNPDGTVSEKCVTNIEDATRFLTAAPAKAGSKNAKEVLDVQ